MKASSLDKRLGNPDIRLIKVESSRNGGFLRCRMFTVPLLRRTGYHVLSYVWGDANREKHEILVNNQPLRVGGNFFHFLSQIWEEQYKHLRKHASTYDECEDAIKMWPEPLHW